MTEGSTRIESLPLVETACWQELSSAVQQRDHEWRTMALASSGTDGVADARTVILRDVDGAQRRLVFYSDSRSGKIEQLRREPRATLLAWSRRLSWQLRLRVRVEVFTEGLEVSSRWARLKLSPAAQDYLSLQPPGAPVAHWQFDRSTRQHFALLQATVDEIDWLELHPEGHRRARLDPAGGRTSWLAP